jgi:hypothetical protein
MVMVLTIAALDTAGTVDNCSLRYCRNSRQL